jgi:glycosyltransferase involved in cell wall biosynthesis
MSRLLSIIIPIYNEEKTLSQILEKVLEINLPENYQKEIILCNDCSKDSSQQIIDEYCEKYDFIKSIKNSKNLGKTQTVKNGLLKSTGDWVVIQDADLEYDPEDLVFMLDQALNRKVDVVYGNRFGQYNGVIYWKNFLGNLFLSIFSNFFTIFRIRVFIPDMEVCYKMIRGDIIREIAPQITSTSNFGFEPEITARLGHYCKNIDHLNFLILPISYYPRSIEEGKKMNAFKDGIKALVEIVKFNLFR